MKLVFVHTVVVFICCFNSITGYGQEVDNLEAANYFASTYEFIPDVEEQVVAERLQALEREVPLTYNTKTLGFINYFLIKDRTYTKKVAALQSSYFPIIEKHLAAYGLPDELKYLAIVESGLNPRARSRAGAVGLWQFMPLTGRLDYDLHENWFSDNKMDFEKSTIAACRYLSFLYNYFDQNWHLALAAYNSGPGNVRKAIRRSGYKKSFWEIYPYLFRETRSYVPQFIALTYAMNYLEEHNIFIEEKEFLPQYDTIQVSQFFNVNEFSNALAICKEEIELLNPELKHGAIAETAFKYPLRVPAHIKPFIIAKRDSIYNASASGKAYWEKLARNEVGSTYGRQKLPYKVRSGDVLGKIAQTYDVRVSDIRQWNNLSGNVIRVGQTLDIWVADNFYDQVNEKMAKASNPINSTKQLDLKSGVYQVQPGDTLWDISRKFDGLTVEKLKKLNNLEGNAIKPGQRLKIS